MDPHDRSHVAHLPCLALTLALFAGCGGNESAGPAAPDVVIGEETGSGDAGDVGDSDAVSDASADPVDDAREDAGADAAADTPVDADAEVEAGADAGEDCDADEACATGLWCFAGVCSVGDCARGEATCVSDTRIAVCERGVVLERACGAGETCLGDAGAARCTAPLCEPDAIGCLDAETAFLCGPDGTALTELPCRADQYCDAGACVARACEPSTRRCSGDNVIVCDETGSAASVIECDAACDSIFGCTCVEGACEARVCTPDTALCDGNTAVVCDATGRNATRSACGDDVCVGGACLDAACEPREVTCIGDTLSTCNDAGTERTTGDCAAESRICDPARAIPACVDRRCTPLASRCFDADSRAVCDGRGAEERVEDCEAGEVCAAGACVPRTCTPGATRCAGETLFTCNASGTAETSTNCASSARYCDASGTPRCRDRVCTPGAVQCRDGDVARCNTRGSAWETIEACPEDCVSGACVDAPPQPDGAACSVDSDCASNLCTTSVCTPQGFVYVPPGTFRMGRATTSAWVKVEETPGQTVTLTRGLYFGQAEITQQVWEFHAGSNPSQFAACGELCPVETVSFYDALWFANLISENEGLEPCYLLSGCSGTPGGGCESAPNGFCTGDYVCTTSVLRSLACEGYRLPTEAEWEWAVGRGTTTDFVAGGTATDLGCDPEPALSPYAWYCDNSAVTYAGCRNQIAVGGNACSGTTRVGQMDPAPAGIYDALGNVSEVTYGYYRAYEDSSVTDPLGGRAAGLIVRRGGAWWTFIENTRITARPTADPAARSNLAGLRLVRTAFPGHCSNGSLDGDETDLDCGGSCAGCVWGEACGEDTDCLDNFCVLDFCF